MVNKFFMHRAKETRDGNIEKGTETHPTYDSAKQSYHSYLGAYAYGKVEDVTFVQCSITDKTTQIPLMGETWIAQETEPEQ